MGRSGRQRGSRRRITGAALLLLFGSSAWAEDRATGILTLKSKSGVLTFTPKFAYLVKGPDVVDNSVKVRHLILSTVDLGKKIAACQTLSCADQDLLNGMTVDFDAGPRLNYRVTLNDQRVQYSGTVKLDAFTANANSPGRFAGRLRFDATEAGGPVVDLEFDATVMAEFQRAQ